MRHHKEYRRRTTIHRRHPQVPTTPSTAIPSSSTAEIPAIAPYRTMRGNSDFVEGIVHLLGGQHIITCSYYGSPRLWDLESSAQIGNDWEDNGYSVGLKTIALSPKGDIIASGSIDVTVRLWDVETGKVIIK